jgi:hypothetical protein
MTLALIRSAGLAACPAWVPDPASPDIWCRGRGRGRGDDFCVGCMVGLRVHPPCSRPSRQVRGQKCRLCVLCVLLRQNQRFASFAWFAVKSLFSVSSVCSLWKIPVPIRADPCESVVSLPPLRSLRSLWLNPPPPIRVNSCPPAVLAPVAAGPCESVVKIRIKTGNEGDRFSGFAPHFSAIRGLISRRLRRFARNNSQAKTSTSSVEAPASNMKTTERHELHESSRIFRAQILIRNKRMDRSFLRSFFVKIGGIRVIRWPPAPAVLAPVAAGPCESV